LFRSIIMHNDFTPDAGECQEDTLAKLPSTVGGKRADEALAAIRERLDRDLPRGPYITDAQFAKILSVTTKTLANKRALEHNKVHKTFPQPFRHASCRVLLHSRSTIIEWLAQSELDAMARTVHRCH
jgi:hypothetical protein